VKCDRSALINSILSHKHTTFCPYAITRRLPCRFCRVKSGESRIYNKGSNICTSKLTRGRVRRLQHFIHTSNLSAHFTYKIANIEWKPKYECNHVQFILVLGNDEILLLVGVASEGVDFVADGESVVPSLFVWLVAGADSF
jgi:hypothetical protein